MIRRCGEGLLAKTGTAFEFLVDLFERIEGSQACLMGGWQSENGEAFGQVFFQFRSAIGSGECIRGEGFLDALLRGGEAVAKEDASVGASDISALINPRNVSLGVLLEVELAALPRDCLEAGTTAGVGRR